MVPRARERLRLRLSVASRPFRPAEVGRPIAACVLPLLASVGAGCAKDADAWRAELDSRDPFVSGLAAIGLALEQPGAAQAVPELLKSIDRTHVGLERAAALVLSQVGAHHVATLLDHLVVDVRMSVHRRGAIKNALVVAGAPAVDEIVACLRGPGSQLAGDLGDVLLVIGAPAVPALARTLAEEEDLRLRKFALFLLARLGPAARAAAPELRAAATASDPELSALAREALGAIGVGPGQPGGR